MRKPEKSAPLTPDIENTANELASFIDKAINPGGIRTNIFALLISPIGRPTGEQRTNYISNCDRGDMLNLMKEFIGRAEGTYISPFDAIGGAGKKKL